MNGDRNPSKEKEITARNFGNAVMYHHSANGWKGGWIFGRTCEEDSRDFVVTLPRIGGSQHGGELEILHRASPAFPDDHEQGRRDGWMDG